MKSFPLALHIYINCIFLIITPLQAIAINSVVEVDDPAPGLVNTTFYSFGVPSINEEGEVGFSARLTSPDDSSLYRYDTIWFGEPSNIKVVARENQPSLIPGITFLSIGAINSDPIISDDGVAFDVVIAGTNDEAIYFYDQSTATLQEVIRTGVGQVQNIIRWGFQDGNFAVYAEVDGELAVLTGTVAGLQVMLKVGDSAPGFDPEREATISSFTISEMPVSPNGQTSFYATVSDNVPGGNFGIYVGSAGNIRLANDNNKLGSEFSGCVFTSASSGGGETWRTVGPNGEAVFYHNLSCDTEPTFRNGVFIESAGTLTAAITNQTPTGIQDVIYNGFYDYHLGANNTFVIRARLSNDTTNTNNVILAGNPGNLQKIAKEGEAAPDGSDIYYEITSPSIDSNGNISFKAIMNFSGAQGIFRYSGSSAEILAESYEEYFVFPELPGLNECGGRTFLSSSGYNWISFPGSQSERGTNSLDGKQSPINGDGDVVFRGRGDFYGDAPWEGIYTSETLQSDSKRNMAIWLDFNSDVPFVYSEVRHPVWGFFFPYLAPVGIDLIDYFGFTPASNPSEIVRQDISLQVCSNINRLYQLGQFRERIPVTRTQPQTTVQPIRINFGKATIKFPQASLSQEPFGHYQSAEDDRFNRKDGGNIAIIEHQDFNLSDNVPTFSDLIIHEIGHALGLRHNLGNGNQTNIVMDYHYSSSPIEFTNSAVPIVEPPRSNTEVISCQITHNPEYHLLRYGWCTQTDKKNCPIPTGMDLMHGTWDTASISDYEISQLTIIDDTDDFFDVTSHNFRAVIQGCNQSSASNTTSILETIDIYSNISENPPNIITMGEGRFSFVTYSDVPESVDIFFGTGDITNPEFGIDLSQTGIINGTIFQYLEHSDTFVSLGTFSLENNLSAIHAGTTTMDTDQDGLSDEFEDAIGSNPNISDTDGDGLSDYDEVAYDGDAQSFKIATDINPTLSDTDGDGVSDATDTNPLVSDVTVPYPIFMLPVLFILISIMIIRTSATAT